jgi:hypothetical protein
MTLCRAFGLTLLLLGVSCASAPLPRRSANDIRRVEVLPASYMALGTARARCATTPPWGQLDAEPLTRFECTRPALERALAEQAASRGGSLLAGMRCQSSASALSCAATIGAPAEGASSLTDGSSQERPADGDELAFEKARGIEVDLEPTTKTFARRSRAARDVGVQLAVPVSHRALGSLTARCTENMCGSDDLRVALRVAAGALGVSDVAEVACGVRGGAAFCVATLAAAELDPETDPRAR